MKRETKCQYLTPEFFCARGWSVRRSHMPHPFCLSPEAVIDALSLLDSPSVSQDQVIELHPLIKSLYGWGKQMHRQIERGMSGRDDRLPLKRGRHYTREKERERRRCSLTFVLASERDKRLSDRSKNSCVFAAFCCFQCLHQGTKCLTRGNILFSFFLFGAPFPFISVENEGAKREYSVMESQQNPSSNDREAESEVMNKRETKQRSGDLKLLLEERKERDEEGRGGGDQRADEDIAKLLFANLIPICVTEK